MMITNNPLHVGGTGRSEQDPEFDRVCHIAHGLARGDDHALESVAGTTWATRETDAALIAAQHAARDGNLVFLRPAGDETETSGPVIACAMRYDPTTGSHEPIFFEVTP